MIRHIAFFSAIDPNDLDTIEAGLWVLKDNPHAESFAVHRNLNLDEIPGPHPDFVVMADIKDEEALAAYKAHPLYAESIRLVRPLRDIRVAADLRLD
ncbi:Dabb family protein [Octadecabacter sp. 1_MG-2023]|uniref:Dabb family protein n=1 Tax=Octadecabacter TaxID=53945 RepID=UPI001C0A2E2B|nr:MULTISPECIES: Dabb family protein [Octadecabacter]MBU2992895.1 Dabb family protein [Octadecabacter sp. B2R22]MCF2904390.1 Dabb family protein [Octadecabacter algicola]MDO6733654.1 Dabb family protein [Octadecabacter sp. 1_MG-2023]